ncbi:MAG: type II secretion system F family protein [Actinomycetota bacterium]
MTEPVEPRRRRLAHRRARRNSAVAFLASLVLLLAAAATPAFGQEEQESDPAAAPPELLLVDATGDPYAVIRTADEPAQVEIATGGVRVDTGTPIAVADSDLPLQTVIVIDNSAESAEYLDAFATAANEYLDNAPRNEQIEIWTTGGTARMRVGFNTNHDRSQLVVDGIVSASGSNHLWDGVRGGALKFEDSVAGATNVLIFTANIDSGSTVTAAQARGTILDRDASVFMVHAGETTSTDETRLVNVSAAGAYALAEDQELIAAYGPSLTAAVANTYIVPFSGDAVETGVSIEVVVEGFAIAGSYSFGAVTDGRALAPLTVPEPTTLPGLGFLEGETAKRVGIGLGVVAAVLGAYSLAMLFQKNQSGLNDMLEAYADPYAPNVPEEEGGKSFAKNLFVKRAVEITEGFAERQGSLERAERMLERADLPLRAGEALTAYAGIVLGSLAIGILFLGGIVGLIIMGALGVLVPPAVVNFMANRRTKAFLSQLPDMLQLLSSTLKAGYSFMQGVEAVSHEVEEPMGGELRRIVTEAQLGRPLEDAMDASAERMDSPDFAWCVMAVKIQREVGGNLSELLMTVAETMTARERLRRDVASLTAEGKMSAIVLAALPILLGFAMWALNPEYINTLFTESLGKILLGASITAALIGFAWMKKIIAIEI